MADLSYLEVSRLAGDVYIGGIMTVNNLGIPKEFLHSEPVCPTKLQINLYGTTLHRYLMLDVIGKGLVEASKSMGSPVIVGHGDLLHLATRVKRPLCQLTATTQRPLEQAGDIQEGNSEEVLVQLSDTQTPYVLRFFDKVNFPVESHLNCLMDCAAQFDVLEPLNRVRRTIKFIHGEGQSGRR